MDELVKEIAWRGNLATYAHHLSGGAWIPYKHVKYIADRVQEAVIAGNKRLLISMPPRHGKSELVSKWLPLWYLDRYPDRRVILTSYEQTVAMDWGREVRSMFEDPDLNTWTQVESDNRSARDWTTTDGGRMKCTGAGGPITGKGFDLGIIDDPIKNWSEASSPTIQRRLEYWMWSTFYTRCEPGATIIGVMTRWNENDLFGHILSSQSDEEWEYIRIPAICEDEDDLLDREIGEALCPERYPLEDLLKKKSNVPPSVWAGLYQQRPAPEEGAIVKQSDVNYLTNGEFHDLKLKNHTQSWDLTFKATGNSFVVGQVWAQDSDLNFYLIDQIRERMGFTETLKSIRSFTEKHPKTRSRILIEDKANGPAIIDQLKSELGKGIIPVQTKGSKQERLQAVSVYFNQGRVFVNTDHNYTDDWLQEITTFPFSKNDDQVDATAQALSYLGKDRSTKKSRKMLLDNRALKQVSGWNY